MSNEKILVANLVNTEKNKLPDMSWIDYYESCLDDIDKQAYERYTKDGCPCCGAQDADLVGAHVGILGESGFIPYIAPVCETCNTSKKVMELPAYLPLIVVPPSSEGYNEIEFPDLTDEE